MLLSRWRREGILSQLVDFKIINYKNEINLTQRCEIWDIGFLTTLILPPTSRPAGPLLQPPTLSSMLSSLCPSKSAIHNPQSQFEGWGLDLILELKTEPSLRKKNKSISPANSRAVPRWSHPGSSSLVAAARLACKEIPREP